MFEVLLDSVSSAYEENVWRYEMVEMLLNCDDDMFGQACGMLIHSAFFPDFIRHVVELVQYFEKGFMTSFTGVGILTCLTVLA